MLLLHHTTAFYPGKKLDHMHYTNKALQMQLDTNSKKKYLQKLDSTCKNKTKHGKFGLSRKRLSSFPCNPFLRCSGKSTISERLLLI